MLKSISITSNELTVNNQSINLSIYPSIYLSINQSINQSSNQANNQSNNRKLSSQLNQIDSRWGAANLFSVSILIASSF